jgi:translation initiation factor IF-3
MVSVTVGFALMPIVSCVSFRPGATFHLCSGPLLVGVVPGRAPPVRLMVIARYSPSYVSEEEEEENEEGL